MNPLDLPVHEIPALSGNNAPVQTEDTFTDMQVIGEVPKDLNGLYVRNGPNPYFSPIGDTTHLTAMACCTP